MGAFLEKPKTEKYNESKTGAGLRYGLSSMQGWRLEMEDAHSAVIGLPDIGQYFNEFFVMLFVLDRPVFIIAELIQPEDYFSKIYLFKEIQNFIFVLPARNFSILTNFSVFCLFIFKLRMHGPHM